MQKHKGILKDPIYTETGFIMPNSGTRFLKQVLVELEQGY